MNYYNLPRFGWLDWFFGSTNGLFLQPSTSGHSLERGEKHRRQPGGRLGELWVRISGPKNQYSVNVGKNNTYIYNIYIIYIYYPIFEVSTTHLWWFGGWFIVLPALYSVEIWAIFHWAFRIRVNAASMEFGVYHFFCVVQWTQNHLCTCFISSKSTSEALSRINPQVSGFGSFSSRFSIFD